MKQDTRQSKGRKPENLQAESIDQVIESLDRIITWAKANNSRMGYFAALYRKVTIAVRDGIEKGTFENGPAMERLDTVFANRYLEAFEKYQQNEPAGLNWEHAFEMAGKKRPIVLQHLLLAMNAHIHLDLGIAAADSVEPGRVEEIKNDFFRINELLAGLTNEVQNELAKIWPMLKLLDFLAGPGDEALAKFAMKISRGKAWRIARRFSFLDAQKRRLETKKLDRRLFPLAGAISKPGVLLTAVLILVRITERYPVPKIIEILE